MSQFDVYRNPDRTTQVRIPYVLVLQSDLLERIDHYVVAPLRIADDSAIPVLRLNPLALVDGQKFHIRVQDVATVPRHLLKAPVANLSSQREEILAALDFLFTGF